MKFIRPVVKLDTDIEDASWAYYSKNPLIRWVYVRRLRKSLRLASENTNQKILDIGVGCGILLPSLAKYGEVSGVDYNEKFLDKAEKMCGLSGISSDLSQIDLNEDKFPYENNYFDSIFCLSVLEHVRDLDKVLEEVNRILKDNGTLIIGIPVDRFLVKWFFKQQKIEKQVKEEHIQNYKTIERKLREHFNIIKIDKIPSKIIPDLFSIYKIYKCVKK